jgi:hypothetical protein
MMRYVASMEKTGNARNILVGKLLEGRRYGCDDKIGSQICCAFLNWIELA